MNFFRSIWPDYIDDTLPLGRKQRKAIHKAAWRLWWKRRWNFLIYLSLPAGYVVMLYAARQALDLMVGGVMGPWARLLRIATLVVVPVLCFILGGAVLQRWRFAPCVYQAARELGLDLCPRCGYWLRGLDDEVARCPECGGPREPMPQRPSDAVPI